MRSQKKEPKKVSWRYRADIFNILLLSLGAIFLYNVWTSTQQVQTIPYSDFEGFLAEKRISDVVITDNYIEGTLKDAFPNGRRKFVTAIVEESLASKLDRAGISYTRLVENGFFGNLLLWLSPVLLFFGIWLFVAKRAAQGGFGSSLLSIGKSRAKVYAETDTKTTFNDIAGVDEAKEELVEIVNFLKDRARFGRLGARIPRGILLVGPPGTGKTLLAKAVAGEAAVPFFSINGSEFVEMFVGVGAARVRDLFEQARLKAPCIIFIDELDALGRSRTVGLSGGGLDEKDQTLNQLLVELDGFDSQAGIVLLAATNRPEILDPALLRSGRFDRQILVDRPDRNGRLEILKVHTRKIALNQSVNLADVAGMTAGFTGADLENLANEAALIATRRDAAAIDINDFTQAMERIVAGLEKKNRLLREEEKTIVAYHEMGHALVAGALPTTDVIHKVSIIPRGIGSLGYTIQRPTEDRYLMTKAELENKMTVLMAGRASEDLVFGHLSSGAADDISKATNIAKEMVMRYGMDETLGAVTYDERPPTLLGVSELSGASRKNYSEKSSVQIDDAVKSLINKALRASTAILKKNRHILEESAQLLLKSETLHESELKAFFAKLERPIDEKRLNVSKVIGHASM